MSEDRGNSGTFWAAFFGAAIGSGALAKIHLAPIVMVALAIGTIVAIVCCVRAAFSWLPNGIRGPAHAGFWLGAVGWMLAGCMGLYRGVEAGEALLRIVGAGIAGAVVLGLLGAIGSRSERSRHKLARPKD